METVNFIKWWWYRRSEIDVAIIILSTICIALVGGIYFFGTLALAIFLCLAVFFIVFIFVRWAVRSIAREYREYQYYKEYARLNAENTHKGGK